MKTFLLFALGLFLLALAATALKSAVHDHWDVIELAIAAALAYGGVRALRAGGKRVDSTKPPTKVGG